METICAFYFALNLSHDAVLLGHRHFSKSQSGMSLRADARTIPTKIEIMGNINLATKGCVLTMRLHFKPKGSCYDEILPLPGGCVPSKATLSWGHGKEKEIKIVDKDRCCSDFWRDFEDVVASDKFNCVVSYSDQGTSLTIVNCDNREFNVSIRFINRLSVSRKSLSFVIPAAPERSDFSNRKYELMLQCEGAGLSSFELNGCSYKGNRFEDKGLSFSRPLEWIGTGERIKSEGNAALRFPKSVRRIAFFIEYTAQCRTRVANIERELVDMFRDLPDDVFKQVEFTVIKYGERQGIFTAETSKKPEESRKELANFVFQESRILFRDFNQALQDYRDRNEAVLVLLSRGITESEFRSAHPVVFLDRYYSSGAYAVAKRYDWGYAFSISAPQFVSTVHRLMKRRAPQGKAATLGDLMKLGEKKGESEIGNVQTQSIEAFVNGISTANLILIFIETGGRGNVPPIETLCNEKIRDKESISINKGNEINGDRITDVTRKVERSHR